MNPVTHFEIPYKDADRASKFYKEVFGWDLKHLGPEMNNYILATTATKDVKPSAPAGAIGGGLFPVSETCTDQHPSVVIGVENIQASMDFIVSHGGEILGEPHEIPGFGNYVSFKDPEGNKLSIIEPKM